MTNTFEGEHLLPGQIGYLFIVTAFVASLFSCFSYFRAVKTETADPSESKSWLGLGRWSFGIHTFSIIGIFAALFYVIANHLFEYHYAWSHSSLDLPGKYLLSCFWEGQEGSFMLWIFWQALIGVVIMKTAKTLETRTMTIIALVQAVLCTMILGIYIGNDIKIGSTPFVLLRHMMQGAPIFSVPNYLDFVKDGNGLNVSLQNYWMVIHPPVLFLGFALTIVPFALSLAALWRGDYKEFVKPTIAWTLVAGAVLGTGIMMGGKWAYESLNFGGYWAWDPVENASLVPWLTLIGGLHTILVFRSTKRALPITFVFLIFTYLLVWYSTFLTRTGILGKTSVHAFTGDGQALYYHLLVVIAGFLALSLGLLMYRWKTMPRIKEEEATLSREFWMFIGAAVLFIAGIAIIWDTSLPVWAPLVKMISGKEMAPPVDVIKHYNDIHVWIAIIIGFLSGLTMYMKYKDTTPKKLWTNAAIAAGLAAIMAMGIGYSQRITTWQYSFMLFSTCFAIVGSLHYGIAVQKLKFKNLGPVTAHFGFGAVLLGILLSSYNKHPISYNTTGEILNFGKGNAEAEMKENRENVILFFGIPVAVGDYAATYIGDSAVEGKDKRVYYKVRFEKYDSASQKVTESFMLYPDAFINPKGNQMGLSANPDTKHYMSHDIYTFINQATDKSKSDTSSYRTYIMHKKGDTAFLPAGFMVFNGFDKDIKDPRYKPGDSDIAVAANLTIFDKQGKQHSAKPLYIFKNREYVAHIEDTIKEMNVFARLDNIVVKSQDSAYAELKVRQTDPKDDFIVLKALVFPFINVLWIGVIIVVFGFFISLAKLMGGKAKPELELE